MIVSRTEKQTMNQLQPVSPPSCSPMTATDRTIFFCRFGRERNRSTALFKSRTYIRTRSTTLNRHNSQIALQENIAPGLRKAPGWGFISAA